MWSGLLGNSASLKLCGFAFRVNIYARVMDQLQGNSFLHLDAISHLSIQPGSCFSRRGGPARDDVEVCRCTGLLRKGFALEGLRL